jgi:predicted nucleic acid-binding Zn ribbon protein
MTDEVRALLAAVEDAEERCKKYSRRAALLEWLYLVLLISAMVFLFLGAVMHLLYGYDHRPPLAVSAVLWIVGYAVYLLHVIYDSKAAETARQACELRCRLELEMRRTVSVGRA